MHPTYLLQKFCQQKETVLAHVNQYVKNRKNGRFAFQIFFSLFFFKYVGVGIKFVLQTYLSNIRGWLRACCCEWKEISQQNQFHQFGSSVNYSIMCMN